MTDDYWMAYVLQAYMLLWMHGLRAIQQACSTSWNRHSVVNFSTGPLPARMFADPHPRLRPCVPLWLLRLRAVMQKPIGATAGKFGLSHDPAGHRGRLYAAGYPGQTVARDGEFYKLARACNVYDDDGTDSILNFRVSIYPRACACVRGGPRAAVRRVCAAPACLGPDDRSVGRCYSMSLCLLRCARPTHTNIHIARHIPPTAELPRAAQVPWGLRNR